MSANKPDLKSILDDNNKMLNRTHQFTKDDEGEHQY